MSKSLALVYKIRNRGLKKQKTKKETLDLLAVNPVQKWFPKPTLNHWTTEDVSR